MNITEVRIKLADRLHYGKLLGFATVTIDNCFCIKDVKIVDGRKGPFVAMPCRKLADKCDWCRTKNHLRQRHCGGCGKPLDPERAEKDHEGRPILYVDICHPTNHECRFNLRDRVLAEWQAEWDRREAEGDCYVGRHDQDDIGFGEDE